MNLHGIFPPIATPFTDDEIDLDGMRSNVTKWMKTGLAGVLVLGSNGEAPMLDAGESFRVASAARESVPAGRTLIVGAGEESTHSTIAAVKCRTNRSVVIWFLK
jgi:4-hydroxy-2-oxoglutarate aldolase